MGAVSKEDSGLYFSWGNTEGHAEGSGYDFSQETYNATPGAAITANLSLSQDAARANLGAAWRMPTSAEFQELYDNCISVWTTINGVAGRLFKSNVNGNTLFFPANGKYDGTLLNYSGSIGYYWSSECSSEMNAYMLNFSISNVNPRNADSRHDGICVRAVLNF